LFRATEKTPAFVILDLEDSIGFEIASHFHANCADNRNSIKNTRAYPAFTLVL